jgi:hypothetical protein
VGSEISEISEHKNNVELIVQKMAILQIGDKLVSMDIITEHFCCDLDTCHGACCVEGDSGAPVTLDEIMELEDALPAVWDDLSPQAREVIDSQGVAYTDTDGTLVTSIVGGRDCVFTVHEGGCCHCALEKACTAGKISFQKPLSCYLYPIRVSQVGECQALNYHRWNICRCAVAKGEKEGVPVYRFLKEPLVRAFGQDWYDELELTVREMKAQGYLK